MRVLVYTPVYGEYLSECRASVLGQVFSGVWDWTIDDDDPYPPPDLRNVQAKYKRAWAATLAGGYDALLTVEQDMLLPPDALQKLWDAGGEFVYGVYMLRHRSNVINAWRYEGNRNMGMSLSLYPRELAQLRQAGELVRVSGVGWGCTLIRRSVVERMPLHDGNGTCLACDIPLAIDCLRAGIVLQAHFGVLCGHVEEGKVLMVDDNTLDVTKVVALQRVTVNNDGQTVVLEPDKRYILNAALVIDLVRAGYVRAVPIEQALTTPAAEQAVMPAGKRRRA
jgi:hypothetical protein